MIRFSAPIRSYALFDFGADEPVGWRIIKRNPDISRTGKTTMSVHAQKMRITMLQKRLCGLKDLRAFVSHGELISRRQVGQ